MKTEPVLEFKTQLAKVMEKYNFNSMVAIDKKAVIGYGQNNRFNLINTNFVGACFVPGLQDHKLDRPFIDILWDFAEDLLPMFEYYGVSSISSAEDKLFKIKFDDGGSFVLQNVTITFKDEEDDQ